MASIAPPSGFRDFLNDEARIRLKLMSTISEVYQSFGFLPLETPALENLEILQGPGGGGEENEKLIFKVLKRGEKLQEALSSQDENRIAEFGLRFDLTLPLSRVVAHHRGKIHFPWKVFHIGPVWRAERAQKGRFREFVQCDVDIVGSKGIAAEIEVIQAVVTAVHAIGARGFELRLNDRRLIQAMGESLGLSGKALDSFAVILDKKDKLERADLLQQLKEVSGADEERLAPIVDGNLSLEKMEHYHPTAAKDLQQMISTLKALHLPLENITYDPSLVRGMGYYTGPVFELKHASAGYSFGGGGRYDRLVGRFSGQDVPACGFSIGFERLALLLAESEQAKMESSSIFMPVFDESLRASVLGVAQTLRSNGLIVDVYSDQAKVKNQFKFASDLKYRWVLIIGDEEWKTKKFKLKDFHSGQETEVAESELISKLAVSESMKKSR